jgi:hypothetical protein
VYELFTYLTSLIISWLGRYARVIDHLAVKTVDQGAPLGGGSTLHPFALFFNKRKGSVAT